MSSLHLEQEPFANKSKVGCRKQLCSAFMILSADEGGRQQDMLHIYLNPCAVVKEVLWASGKSIVPLCYVNRLIVLCRLYGAVQARWTLYGWVVIIMTGWDKFWFLLIILAFHPSHKHRYWLNLSLQARIHYRTPVHSANSLYSSCRSSCLLKTHCTLLFLRKEIRVWEQVLCLKSSPYWTLEKSSKTWKSQMMQRFSFCNLPVKNLLAAAGFW